jgi:hypothetical protein
MESCLLRESASSWAKREAGKPTLYLRRAIRWTLSVFSPVLIVWSLAATCAFGQTAQVSGVVTDSSGAALPRASVTALNRDTGISRASESNSGGYYTVPLLQPGNYMITVKAVGFATQVRTGITLEVGAQQVFNITMQVGALTQEIEVTGTAAEIQLGSSDLGAVVNSTTVRELPLNGRSWTDLASLEPGVAVIQTQANFTIGANRGNRGFGNQITVGGARPQQNNYRLDGVNINDYANGAPGSVLGGDLGVDAIQEFSVLTSNYSTEYGRTSGGVINAITRSGTNQIHGGVYEFLRNSALDARNFFDTETPPFRRNQFGADVGGPIRKDKMFFFADYEGIRQSKGITTVDTVPSIAARGGTIHYDTTKPAPTGCTVTVFGTCTVNVDPSVQKYLPFWHLPNGGDQPGTNGDIGIFNFVAQQVVSENFVTARVDTKFSDKDSLAVTYLGDVTPFSSPDGLDVLLKSSKTSRQIAVLGETHVFSPTLLNSVRFGYSRNAVLDSVPISAINPLTKDPSLAAIPGQFAAQVKVSGLTDFNGGLLNDVTRYAWNSFQAYDDVFWTHGAHALKFGATVERMQLNRVSASSPAGFFKFDTLSDFLTNQPSRFTAGLTPLYVKALRETLMGIYVQDDWRYRPNLTINIGLRWEATTVPTEIHGRFAILTHITDKTPQVGGPFFSNPTLHNFEPRVGFAWDPFHNGKTALRGGFGMFDVLPLPSQFVLAHGGFPVTQDGAAKNLPQGSFFTGATILLNPTSLGANFIEQHPHRSYAMQWNLNVQRELARNLTAMVGYVGSRGVHQPVRADDADIVFPTKTPEGYLFPVPGSGTNININFGSIDALWYGGNSVYHALEVGIHKAMSRGVQLQGSYTWGKSIDTGSATVAGDQFSNSISSLPWYDLKAVRGLSDYNIGRTLVISGTWQVPSRKSLSGPAAWITGGWELGAIYKASDGVPFTPTFGTDGDPQGLSSSDPWAFPNRLGGSGCKTLTNPGNPGNYIKTECFALPTAPPSYFTASTPMCSSDPRVDSSVRAGDAALFQCFNLRGNAGRNILTGPGTSVLDFSVFKNNSIKRISENFNVQFRVEVFNILNHPNFALPVTPDNTDIFDSSGTRSGLAGKLTSTTTTAREIQVALKLVW